MQFLICLCKNLILTDILNLFDWDLIIGFVDNLIIAAVFSVKEYITQQFSLLAIATLSDMLDRSELRQEICHITIYYAIWNIALLVLLAGYQQTGIKYILTDCKLVCRALKYIAFILVLTCKPHIIIDFLQGCIAICI